MEFILKYFLNYVLVKPQTSSAATGVVSRRRHTSWQNIEEVGRHHQGNLYRRRHVWYQLSNGLGHERQGDSAWSSFSYRKFYAARWRIYFSIYLCLTCTTLNKNHYIMMFQLLLWFNHFTLCGLFSMVLYIRTWLKFNLY